MIFVLLFLVVLDYDNLNEFGLLLFLNCRFKGFRFRSSMSSTSYVLPDLLGLCAFHFHQGVVGFPS